MSETSSDYITIGDVRYGYDEIVNAKVASRIIGLSERTIRDMAVQRLIPIYRLARNVTGYLVSDLVEWTEERRIDQSQDKAI